MKSHYTWKPKRKSEVQSIVDEDLANCTESELNLFSEIKIPLTQYPIERSGKIEHVYAVGKYEHYVLFYEDVEGGFELSIPDTDGVLRNYGANQFNLNHCLYQISHETEYLT